jgi:PPP family 3-phenylpropionic acid transporter
LKTIRASIQRTYFDWRIIVYYLLAFGSGGVIKPFLNLYLVEVGLTGTQIGIIQGWTALVAIFVTPLIGLLADRTQRHRFILGLVAFTKGISAPLMPLSNAWLWLTTTVSLRVISAGAHDAILNRLTLARLKQNHSQKLGSVRFWGSLSFAATSMLSGMVARGRSVAVLFPLAGVLGTIAVFFVGAFPARMAERQSMRASRERLPKRSSHLLLLLLIIFLFTFGRSGPETFAYVFLSKDLSADNDLIGLLGALTWLAALPAYYVADWLLRRWGSVVTMAISFGLYIFGWSGYALIPHPVLALPLVALEGFGQALYLVSMVILLGELSLPERAATDQMLAQLTVPGLASMIAQPVSGWLFDTLGGRSLFAFDALIVLLTTGLLLARANQLETASLSSHRQQREPK